MNITILCIGKLKEKYWTDAIQEYSKRLRIYCTLTINELKEEKAPDNPSPAEEMAVRGGGGEKHFEANKKGRLCDCLGNTGKSIDL